MKRTLLIIVAAFMTIGVKAQFFYSNNQQFIKDAVINGFVVVEQSYQLQDTVTHQLYGRNNQVEFGKLRGIAIKTKDGYLVSNKLLTPWTVDEGYTRYINQYKGVISKTSTYEIADTVMSRCDIASREAVLQNQYVSLIHDTIFHNNGFITTLVSGKTNGWLVWVTAKKDIQSINPGDEVIYQIYRKDLEISLDSISYDIAAPVTENKILGGIYIVPLQPQIGRVEFNLCGMIENIDGNWELILNKFEEPTQISTGIEQEEITLTPVNSSDSKKIAKKSKKNKNNGK